MADLAFPTPVEENLRQANIDLNITIYIWTVQFINVEGGTSLCFSVYFSDPPLKVNSNYLPNKKYLQHMAFLPSSIHSDGTAQNILIFRHIFAENYFRTKIKSE